MLHAYSAIERKWSGPWTTVNTASIHYLRWTDGLQRLVSPTSSTGTMEYTITGHNPARSPIQIPIDVYRTNLAFILDRLTALTPNVIWATITPVHPGRLFCETEWAWRNEEIDQYNEVALTLIESRGVLINDLHTLVWNNVSEFLSEDQLHLSESGQEACARSVVDCVATFLSPE